MENIEPTPEWIKSAVDLTLWILDHIFWVVVVGILLLLWCAA